MFAKLLLILIILFTFCIEVQSDELYGSGFNYKDIFGKYPNQNQGWYTLNTFTPKNDWVFVDIRNNPDDFNNVYSTVAVAIDKKGQIWSWGFSKSYQLGLGDVEELNKPTKINQETDWEIVSIGNNFVLALKNDSTLWGWGRNDYGQLGDSVNILTKTPKKLSSEKWTKISSGAFHSVGIKKDGTLWAWGLNNHGQLARKNLPLSKYPVEVDSFRKWIDVSAGNNHNLAMSSDSLLWLWGSNWSGQLGTGNTSNDTIIRQNSITRRVKSIATKYDNSAIIDINGFLFTWGQNSYLQSDSISSAPYDYNVKPSKRGNLNNNLKVIAGDHNIYIIKTDSTLWGLGCSSGMDKYRTSDAPISNLQQFSNYKFTSISSGYHLFLALVKHDPLVSSTSVDKNIICVGDTVHFSTTITSGNYPYKYKWTPNFNLESDTIHSPFAYPNKSTTYTLLITDSKGESASFSIPITVINKPKIEVNYNNYICKGNILNATAKGGTQYKWFIDSIGSNNLISETNQLNLKLDTTSTFIVVGNNNICFDYDTIKVNVLPEPIANIGYKGSLSLCKGDTIKLFIKDKLITNNYDWIADGFTRYEDSLSVTKSGIYRLFARNKQNNSCFALDSITITEQEIEKIELLQGDILCEGGKTLIRLSKEYPGVELKWNDGSVSNTLEVNNAGKYWCQAINNNCLQSDTIEVELMLLPQISITGIKELCPNSSATISLVGNYTSCTWSTGEVGNSIVVNKSGNYSATATNNYGCYSIAEHIITAINNNIDYSQFQEIDFGKTLLNKKVVKVLNTSSIEDYSVKEESNYFKFLKEQNKLIIEYSASSLGLHSDTLIIKVTKPCQEEIIVIIKAETEGEQIIELKVADIEVTPGENNVELPILYTLNENISLPTTVKWSAKLSYPTPIYLAEVANDVTTVSSLNNNYINLEGNTNLTETKGKLSTIFGRTFLADKPNTIVNLEEFNITPTYKVIKKDGSIKISNICVPILRSVLFFKPIALEINPNPSTSELNITLSGDYNSIFDLQFVNLNSEIVYSIKLNKTQPKEDYKLLSPLSNGVYQVKLSADGVTYSTLNVIIQK
jgi:alpha-tubulin suppressor-like RCC1 family protein